MGGDELPEGSYDGCVREPKPGESLIIRGLKMGAGHQLALARKDFPGHGTIFTGSRPNNWLVPSVIVTGRSVFSPHLFLMLPFLNRTSVQSFMAVGTQSNQVQLVIRALLAAQFLVVDL